MGMTSDTNPEMVKKSTLLLISLITLVIGFLGGVVYSAYKSGSGIPVSTGMDPHPPAASVGPSTADARQIAALEKQTTENPRQVSTWIQLGHLYFDTNQPEKAIADYEAGIAAVDTADKKKWLDDRLMAIKQKMSE